MNHPLGTLLILTVVIAASRAENEQVTSWFQPWYETYYRRIFSLLTPEPEPVEELTTVDTLITITDPHPYNPTGLSFSCERGCRTTMDCDPGLSCFQATNTAVGCCLKPLKPNETQCVIDDQCKRACESSHCEKARNPSRCLCDPGRHFLFNKCWKECPQFAKKKPVVDENGFSRCELKVDMETALRYMRRNKRQLQSSRVFC